MITRAWNRFWFESADPATWPALRFLLFFGGTLFLFLVPSVHPAGFYANWDPISFYRFLPGPLGETTLLVLRWTWLIAGLCAGLGWGYRWTSWICFAAGTIYLGHDYNFGFVYHSYHMYVLSLGIMALSRPGDRWAVQWVKAYVVYVMFLCGLQKLYFGGGFGWAFSDAFYLRLFTNPQKPFLTRWALEQPLFVSQILAGFALVVVELAAPLAFLGRRLGVFYFFIWSVFHFFVHWTYGGHTQFFSQIFCYAAFLPWSRIPAASSWLKPSRRLLLWAGGILISLQTAATITRTEMFPWSPFPMYSGRPRSENLVVTAAYFVEPDGKEIPVEKRLFLRFQYEYRGRLDLHNRWLAPMKEADIALMRVFSEHFLSDLKEQFPEDPSRRVRFYLEKWHQFTGPQYQQPDERRLIYDSAP